MIIFMLIFSYFGENEITHFTFSLSKGKRTNDNYKIKRSVRTLKLLMLKNNLDILDISDETRIDGYIGTKTIDGKYIIEIYLKNISSLIDFKGSIPDQELDINIFMKMKLKNLHLKNFSNNLKN